MELENDHCKECGEHVLHEVIVALGVCNGNPHNCESQTVYLCNEHFMIRQVNNLINRYSALTNKEREIRNIETMPDARDRLRSIERQELYLKFVRDLKEVI